MLDYKPNQRDLGSNVEVCSPNKRDRNAGSRISRCTVCLLCSLLLDLHEGGGELQTWDIHHSQPGAGDL